MHRHRPKSSIILITNQLKKFNIIENYCCNLKEIRVSPLNYSFDSRNDCNAIIETESNTLIRGCVNTIIPDTVEGIGDCAFSGCSMKSIVIPNSVNYIGSEAFESYCLKEIFYCGTFEEWLEVDIEDNDFEDCNIYFYSHEEPIDDLNYWRYDKDDKPVIWQKINDSR